MTTPPAPVTTAPTTPPAQSGGGSASGSETTKKKATPPPPDTAATEVGKLAASSPGRHICYRVYVGDGGWQHPVCDGATAGSESTQGSAIEAINIAVSGVGGGSADAFREDGGWKAPWKSAVDGVDMYVGTTGKDIRLSGFAVGVSNGLVCRNAFIHGSGWGGLGCDSDKQKWIFGGTTDTTKQLQAIRLTV